MAKRGRCFNVTQYVTHPLSHEVLLTQERIEYVLKHTDSITRYCYILHDKDTYTEEDVRKDPNKVLGALKPPHWHITIACDTSPKPLESVAKWFGVPIQYVEYAKGGSKGFVRNARYMTHEAQDQQDLGKYRYPDAELHTNVENLRDLIDM